MSKHTNEQTNNQTTWNELTDKQTDKQICQQIKKGTEIQTNKQKDTWTNEHTNITVSQLHGLAAVAHRNNLFYLLYAPYLIEWQEIICKQTILPATSSCTSFTLNSGFLDIFQRYKQALIATVQLNLTQVGSDKK